MHRCVAELLIRWLKFSTGDVVSSTPGRVKKLALGQYIALSSGDWSYDSAIAGSSARRNFLLPRPSVCSFVYKFFVNCYRLLSRIRTPPSSPEIKVIASTLRLWQLLSFSSWLTWTHDVSITLVVGKLVTRKGSVSASDLQPWELCTIRADG